MQNSISHDRLAVVAIRNSGNKLCASEGKASRRGHSEPEIFLSTSERARQQQEQASNCAARRRAMAGPTTPSRPRRRQRRRAAEAAGADRAPPQGGQLPRPTAPPSDSPPSHRPMARGGHRRDDRSGGGLLNPTFRTLTSTASCSRRLRQARDWSPRCLSGRLTGCCMRGTWCAGCGRRAGAQRRQSLVGSSSDPVVLLVVRSRTPDAPGGRAARRSSPEYRRPLGRAQFRRASIQ